MLRLLILAAIALGAAVPDFTLKTTAGKETSFASLRAAGVDGATVPVVVAFWSYTCPSGAAAMDRYAELAAATEKKGGRFVAICCHGETAAQIDAYAKEHGIKYPIWVDPKGAAIDTFGVKVVTSTFVVDKDGKLVYKGGLGEGE